MDVTRILLTEQNRKAHREVKCRDSPVHALRHFHLSFLVKYFGLITTFEMLGFLHDQILPLLTDSDKTPTQQIQDALLTSKALTLATIEALETDWSRQKWISHTEAKVNHQKNKLDKLKKSLIIYENRKRGKHEKNT